MVDGLTVGNTVGTAEDGAAVVGAVDGVEEGALLNWHAHDVGVNPAFCALSHFPLCPLQKLA